MRVLLSEGSGLTSRQVAIRLGELGHEVEILSSSALCLARFGRHVRRVHAVPAFGEDPFAWLEAARGVAQRRRVDVLFPTQEQVVVLSAFPKEIGVATVIPPFSALRRVQDKVAAFETLRDASVPQPQGIIAHSEQDLRRVDRFPVFVKRPIGTASTGVRRCVHPSELEAAARTLGLFETGVLVQAEATGPLAMVQAVADEGRVVALHSCVRLREGVSGGAASKESLAVTDGLAQQVTHLIQVLGWHGALSLDVIVSEAGPRVIDVNPRLVEPMNAWFAGVDLVAAMLALALGLHPQAPPPGRVGVRSHQLLLAVLAAASAPDGRRRVAREIADAILHRGWYARSREELTPVAHDPFGVAPLLVTALTSLAWPPSWRWFDRGAVGAYALTPQAWRQIVHAVDGQRAPGTRVARQGGETHRPHVTPEERDST